MTLKRRSPELYVSDSVSRNGEDRRLVVGKRNGEQGKGVVVRGREAPPGGPRVPVWRPVSAALLRSSPDVRLGARARGFPAGYGREGAGASRDSLVGSRALTPSRTWEHA